jgi:CheY-like chemotaxis protein
MVPPKFPLTRGLMFSLALGATPTHIRVAITRPNASSAPRILLVEDESDLALLLAYNLEAEGYVVESVERGDEAELRLAESAPDLIILDWMLPGAACSTSAPGVSASSQRSTSAGDVALGVNRRDNRISLRRPESRRADTRHLPAPASGPRTPAARLGLQRQRLELFAGGAKTAELVDSCTRH